MKHYVSTFLLVLALVLSACNSAMDAVSETPYQDASPPVAVGAEGGACNNDGSCNEGLSCSTGSKICVKPLTVTVQSCEGEGVCPEGYACQDNKCVAIGPLAGEEGGVCLAQNKCADDLECRDALCKKKRCPEGMVYIPAGAFKMGGDTYDDEKPIHDVTISAFCMDEREFTNGDKDLTVFTGFEWPAVYSNPAFNTPQQPLIYVTWQNASDICVKQGKRLPTEAEWEYAARGGKQYEYGTSDGKLTDTNACWKRYGSSTPYTCTVKSYPPPNPFGLYDMSGNAWEWVSDWYGDYTQTAQTDPKGPGNGTYKVLRGGSWINTNPVNLRAAYRLYNNPGYRFSRFGFRCVVAPQDS